MNVRRQVSVPFAVLLVLVAAGVVTGCAKRPSVATVAAPAPTGAAVAPVVAPPPAPAPALAPAPTPAPTVVPPVTVAPAPVPQPEPKPVEFSPTSGLASIHFDFDRSIIRKPDAQILDSNAAWLKANPRHLVLIEGHSDERGTNEYNVALGDRRAAAARDYLIAHGVEASRIKTVSYGEERPECVERAEPCWARNRQARFLTKPR